MVPLDPLPVRRGQAKGRQPQIYRSVSTLVQPSFPARGQHDRLAARIDGASGWAVFRYIQLPKMKRVLTIAVLLRFMDSFMIYTEPSVLTGGGPGNSTTMLSIDLVKKAIGEQDLGNAAAMSIIYFLMTLLVCWLFYTLTMRGEED